MYKTHFLNSSFLVQNDEFQPADIFSQYFSLRSFVEMKISYTIPNDSIFFSKILSVRLIKALVSISLTDPRFIQATNFIELEQQQGILLPQIYRKLNENHQQYLQQTRSRSKSIGKSVVGSTTNSVLLTSTTTSYDQMVLLMRQMFLGTVNIYIFLLPFYLVLNFHCFQVL